MSRSRHKRYFDDYDDQEYVEKFNNRRRDKLKKKIDHDMVGYDNKEEQENADLHISTSQDR